MYKSSGGLPVVLPATRALQLKASEGFRFASQKFSLVCVGVWLQADKAKNKNRYLIVFFIGNISAYFKTILIQIW